MKRFSVVLVLLLTLSGARAEGPDDQYVRIYNLVQEADKRNSGGQPSEALRKYLEAQTALQQFRKGQPDWNVKVVSFRLNYVADKIVALSAQVPTPMAVAVATKPAAAPSADPAQPAQPVPARDGENQLKALQDRVNQLQADKAALEAKLKAALEAKLKAALLVQHAAVHPRELAKAEAKILDLLKENDLLMVNLDQEKAKPAPAPDMKALDEARQALAEANRKLAEQTKAAIELAKAEAKIQDLLKENALLKVGLDQEKAKPAPAPDMKALDEARQALAEANRKLAEQTKAATELAKAEAQIQDLLKENALLKVGLDQEKAKPVPAPDMKALDEARQALAEANRKLAEQTKAATELALDKTALQNQLNRLTSNLANAAGPAAGTNPTDPSRRVAVSAVQWGPRGFSMIFPTVTGKVYAVEYSETLAGWSDLLSGFSGTNGMVEVNDPGALGNARRFYRVRVSQ